MSDNRLVRIQFGGSPDNVKAIVPQDLISTTANIIGTSYKGPAFVPKKLYFSQTLVTSRDSSP